MHAILLTLAFTAFSSAAELNPTWSCSLQLTISGDAGHHFTHGRDSWDGEGDMTCSTRGATPVTRRMRVTYNGYGVGVGANSSSFLKLSIRLRTQAEPRQYQLMQFVKDVDRNEKIEWRLQSKINRGTVIVQQTQGDDIFPSLEMGTLFIRGTVD